MQNIKTRLPLVGLLTVLASSLASAQTAYVAGPLEAVSGDLSQVTVLGQTFFIDAKTIVTDSNHIPLSLGVISRKLVPGAVIAIETISSGRKQKASSLTIARAQYVPGATTVFVGGIVDSVARDVGTVRVGNLVIDLTSGSPEVLSTVQVGDFIEASGIQPGVRGQLLAGQLELTIGAAQSIGGTGVTTSLKSIGGTGTEASALSIGGTGVTTSLKSIGGTGTEASLRSIGGTGANKAASSIGGTGVNAI